jgi:hypothetical protein
MSRSDDESDLGQQSTRSISEGESSRSGYSDEIAAKQPLQKPLVQRSFQDGSILAAAVPKCTMCDVHRSDFICPQCGRLSFCLKCCVSLHDNKFLGTHKLISLDALAEGTECTVSALKEMALQKVAPATQRRKTADPDDVSVSRPVATEWSAADGPRRVEESLDLAAIAADRNVVQARLREMSSCREWLDRLHSDLNAERLTCKETTHTACEAVRRKFDILRNVLAAKEAEYVSVVESAGKKRLDMATQVCCSSSIAIGEVDSFIAQMSNQLSRLEMNNEMFNNARRSMLDETQRRLHGVDDTIHALQSSLDDIRSVSLGVQIVLEDAVAAISAMKPPLSLGSRLHDIPHILPVPSEKFLATPGINVVRQPAEIDRSVQRGPPNSPTKPDSGAPPRKSFAQELQTLRQTPLDALRGNSPARLASASAVPIVRSLLPAQEPAGGSSTASAMARIAARASAAAARTSSPMRQKSSVVPELERLRQQIHATGGSFAAVARADSPLARGRSPIARSSPQRRGSPAPVAATGLSNRSGLLDGTGTPGPGAYYKPHDFNQRSFLSTPPRRRP